METYTFLRQLADSWALLLMFGFFVGVILWAFRPGSNAVHAETSTIPFRHEDRPAAAEDARTERKESRS